MKNITQQMATNDCNTHSAVAVQPPVSFAALFAAVLLRSDLFSFVSTWISIVMLLCSSIMDSYSRPSSRHISSLSLANLLATTSTSLK